MIEQIVNIITLQAVRKGVVDEKELPIIRYGLRAMAEVSIIAVTMLLISLWFDRLIEATVWLGTVILCRSFKRGYHAKTFKSCYLISVSVSNLVLLTIDLVPERLFTPLIILFCTTSILMFTCSNIKWKHGDSPKEEDRFFNKIYISIYLIFLIGTIIIVYLKITNTIFLACSLGFVIAQLSVLIQERKVETN
ncbi:accessory gene regulator B family protein [Paenibacillus macerans]|uniref:accessory gene regulator B family protein n=1 Tax=Paenibacillus macerans TaxID=44252 RepID=UPI00203DF644|nr:accessory gene regulator B family protein [Paenibacillus macerans]MCM3702179.1 accessory gene regulator B family protein [Paenibacillus macerans]